MLTQTILRRPDPGDVPFGHQSRAGNCAAIDRMDAHFGPSDVMGVIREWRAFRTKPPTASAFLIAALRISSTTRPLLRR